MTTGNPNENPVCGKSITITSGGKSVQATITDRCPGCAQGGLDLTPSLFEQFAVSANRTQSVQISHT